MTQALEREKSMIPPAKIHFPEEDLDDLATRLREILRSGQLTLGPYTADFEKAFAAKHRRRFAVAVNSGTSALEIILRALHLRGGEIVLPTNTFAATAFGVLHSGNDVILADVDDDLNLDPEDVARRITPRTKAVVIVHIGGRVTPAIDRLVSLCRQRGIPLLEDAAHAHGSRLGDRYAGEFGQAASFSFYPTKVMTSGEGGMIVTDDEAIANAAKVLRDQGKAGFGRNLHTEEGSNWRLSELHACVGLSQFRRLDEFIEARRRIAAVFDEGLAGSRLEGLLDRPPMRSNYYKYIALLPKGVDRAAVKAKLKEAHGGSLGGEGYEIPLHEQPFLRALGQKGPFPRAEEVCSRHICRPLFVTMTDEQAHRVVAGLREVVG